MFEMIPEIVSTGADIQLSLHAPRAGLAKQTIAFSTSLSSLWLQPPVCGLARSAHSQESIAI